MLAVVLIESRFNQKEIMDRHLAYLPKDCVTYYGKCDSVADYNKSLVNAKFWEFIKEENILIIQHDSALLRTGIEEFYQYDYIGAPIKWLEFPRMNGGLSFRKKSAMLKVIEKIPYNGENEDLYFCDGLKKLGGNLPTKEVAQQFSCETIFNLGSLGYHAIEKYLTPEECEQIKTQYNG